MCSGLFTCNVSALEPEFPARAPRFCPEGLSRGRLRTELPQSSEGGYRARGCSPHYHSVGPKRKETHGWMQTHPNIQLTHVQGMHLDMYYTCRHTLCVQTPI